VVTVHSDFDAELARVEVKLFDELEEKVSDKYTFTEPALPFSFAVEPAPGDAAPGVLVVLTGKDASGEVLAQTKATAAFEPRKIVVVDLWLLAACRGRICAAGETCGASESMADLCGPTPLLDTRAASPGEEVTGNFEAPSLPRAVGEKADAAMENSEDDASISPTTTPDPPSIDTSMDSGTPSPPDTQILDGGPEIRDAGANALDVDVGAQDVGPANPNLPDTGPAIEPGPKPPAGKMCGGFAGLSCDGAQFCNYEIAAGGQGCDGIADGAGVCEATPKECTKEYVPVCGCDHRTYGTACDAHLHGMSVLHKGACTEVDCKAIGGRAVDGIGPAPKCAAGETDMGSIVYSNGQMSIEGTICCVK
jgi:hypothetical protein